MARFKRPNQLPMDTLNWLEHRLKSLERQGQDEEAFALRMEMAEWLLGSPDANLIAPLLP
ncbi:MAG: hypothetical protein CMN96_04825 [Synechococcus sp. MED850]|nr:hypothetical protein [Synechococcus sp. MED850]OUW98169.1 MAG: hypothetical protein CBD89_03545 [Cyanobacteria bacterium TMED229]